MRRTTVAVGAAIAAVVGLAIGLPLALTSGGSSTYYVATNGSDSATCTQTAPCASFDEAFQKASGGDDIEVAAGTYPAQPLNGDRGGKVTIRPAPGAQVTVAGKLLIHASNLEVQDMTASYNVLEGAHIVLRNIDSPASVYIHGGTGNGLDDLQILGGQIHAVAPVKSDSQISGGNGKSATNVVFDGVWFHDFLDVGPGQLHHIECLQVGGVDGLTIKNSHFGPNCETHDIFIRAWGNLCGHCPLDRIDIENNMLEHTGHPGGGPTFYSMQILDDLNPAAPASATVSDNCLGQGIHVAIKGTYTHVNNQTVAFGCTGGVTPPPPPPPTTTAPPPPPPPTTTAPPPTTTAPPPPDPADQAYQEALDDFARGTLEATWRKANKGEAALFDAYVADPTGTPPQLATPTGQGFVDVVQLHQAAK